MNKDAKKDLIKEAIKEYRQEEKKQQRSMVYHNTELLMKNYNELRQHADNAIYRLRQIFREESISNAYKSEHSDNDLEGIMDSDDDLDYDAIYIETILKSKVRTTIMVLHIDMALDILKKNAEKEGCLEKFEIFINLYISNISYEELAKKYHCDVSTIRRRKNDVLRKLGILLFGEEGLISLA